jgi:uncharacterized Fe-S center protein
MSKAYFTKDPSQVDKLFDAAGIAKIIAKDDFVALKIHFGERGNHAFVKPERSKPIVKKVKAAGGKPFWTDANTLYHGSRRNTPDHLQTAFDHGYTSGKTGAHVLIADGLKGKAFEKITVNYKHLKVLYVASLIFEANALIAVTHFKGHELTGFGGALKNIGMGLGSPRGKLDMHSDCKNCEEIKTCRRKLTLEACWIGSPPLVQEKTVEYCGGILERFKNKAAYINFITDVSPNCDCYDHNDPPIVPDLGILSSSDPVAVDQASLDMVNKSAGKDIFRELWPNADYNIQLQYAEEIGLGSRKYELINIE